jgi:hypothetical protein
MTTANHPPLSPHRSSIRRFQELRVIRTRIDTMLRAHWQAFVAESKDLAEAALDRAIERCAERGPEGH